MQGSDDLQPGQAARHVVRLADGSVLNRYWDERDTRARKPGCTTPAPPQK